MRTPAAAVPLRIHPLAAPAFDMLAGILPMAGAGRPRAVAEDGVHLVFAGFGAIGDASAVLGPVIERGLTDNEIEAAAWTEVKALWRILTAPADVVRGFGHDVMAKAPMDVLHDLGLPLNRDPAPALKALPLSPPARAEPVRETAFARARVRYVRSRDGDA